MRKFTIYTSTFFIALLSMGQNSSSTQKNTAMKKVNFKSGGLNLVGNLYLPENFNESKTYPAVIVGGSLTSVKEQMSGIYAEELANRGFIALAFDFSHYGESEGMPRQYEDPAQKLTDLQAAISFLENKPFVGKVGGLGVCTAGGNMAYLAAEDARLRAFATVAAWLPNKETLPILYGSEENLTALRRRGEGAKKVYDQTGENEIILAYSNVDKTASHFGPMEYYMDKNRGGGISAWRNEFAVMSWPTWLDFKPLGEAQKITIPGLVIHSDGSALPNNAREFYNNLKGPKQLAWLDGNHFDFYDQKPQVEIAIQELTKFFDNYLN